MPSFSSFSSLSANVLTHHPGTYQRAFPHHRQDLTAIERSLTVTFRLSCKNGTVGTHSTPAAPARASVDLFMMQEMNK